MAELQAWLDQHKGEYTLADNNKVHCTLTGHDIPKRLEDLRTHWTGRVYRRAEKAALLASNKRGVDFAKLAPHIIPHKKDPTKCFCKLTQLILNNDEKEVEAHMKGRKFQFYLSAYKPKKKAKTEAKELDPVWSRAPDLGEESTSEEDSDPGFPHIVQGRVELEDEGDEGDLELEMEDEGDEDEEKEGESESEEEDQVVSALPQPTKSTTSQANTLSQSTKSTNSQVPSAPQPKKSTSAQAKRAKSLSNTTKDTKSTPSGSAEGVHAPQVSAKTKKRKKDQRVTPQKPQPQTKQQPPQTQNQQQKPKRLSGKKLKRLKLQQAKVTG